MTLTSIAFWHHSPPIRDQWVWLLALAFPFFAVRLHRAWSTNAGRAWLKTPLLPAALIFIALTALNFHIAPYARSDYLVLVCRPLLGIWLMLYAADHVHIVGTARYLVYASVGIALIVSVLALTASQWNNKAAALQPLIDLLPKLDHRVILPDMMLSFNANEIAGAMSWLLPLTVGAAAYVYAGKRPLQKSGFAVALIVAVMMGIALFFGQSRATIIGVLVALTFMAFGMIRSRRWLLLALSSLGLIAVAQLTLVLHIWPLPGGEAVEPGISERDELTVTTRIEMWHRGLLMVADYPLSGVGMSMYRTAVRTPRYEIAVYADRAFGPPHAHNALVQIGADLGVGGLLWYIGLHIAAAWMLWTAWRTSDRRQRYLVAGIAGGILAHSLYGVMDTVTLWDRYSFLFWWMLALVNGVFISAQQSCSPPQQQ